ncbi:MAG TPA: hypothetical protein VE693_00315 [Gaiellaceae bacterium]|nr:hypothetical protein [Gaiellaceae bacterium]
MDAVAPDHDALLQASRRLDWRFLLEQPELGRVACIAKHDPDLIESLRLFSEVLSASRETPESGAASLAACWARYTARLALRIVAGEPRLTEEAVAWVRQNRYYAPWRHTLAHARELVWAR